MNIVGKRVLITTAVVLLIAMAAVYWAREAGLLDRQFIFFPERELAQTPADLGLAYEDVFFHASDGVRLHGWFVPGEVDTTLVWFHGNAGNIGHRLDNLSLFHHRLKVNVFIFDYRGYGKSEGTISEQGSYMDADAAVEYVRSRRDGRLILFGRSLGAAVAVEPQPALLSEPCSSPEQSGIATASSLDRLGLDNNYPLPDIYKLFRIEPP